MKDFLTDQETNDLLIEHGDFVVGDSREMHIADLLLGTPGTWRQWPALGIGVRAYTDKGMTKAALDRLTKKIKLHVTADGHRVSDVVIKLSGNEIYSIEVNAE